MPVPKPSFGDIRAVCPWCKHAHSDSYEWEDGISECSKCGKPFDVEKYLEPSFNTRPAATCRVCGILCPLDKDGFIRTHSRRNQRCDGSKAAPVEDLA
jgi:hypothetical protein